MKQYTVFSQGAIVGPVFTNRAQAINYSVLILRDPKSVIVEKKEEHE